MKIDYKTAYENVMVLNKMLEKEIERLEEKNKDLKLSNIYLSKTCDKYKMELERLNNIINKIEEMLESPWNIECVNQNNSYLEEIHKMKEVISNEGE